MIAAMMLIYPRGANPDRISEIPSNIVIKKVGARNWLASVGAAWGLITLGMGFVHSWQSLAVLRAFLGVLEAVGAEFPSGRRRKLT